MGSTGRTPNVYGIPATLNWCVESIAQLKGQVFGIIQNGTGGGGTQDLASVLLEGNNANNSINLTDGAAYLSVHSKEGLSVNYGDIDGSSAIRYLSDSIIASTNEGTRQTILEFIQATPDGINTISFPDDTGTILLDSLLGVANGIATLAGDGLVPLSQLPFGSALINKGAWNAFTNTPTLIDGTGTNGDFYVVSVGDTRNLGSGSIVFVAGNGVLYNGTVWQQIGAVMTATVTSVTSANNALATVVNTTTAPVITIVSAPKLQTARNINNIAFDGTDNILLNSTYNNQTGTTYTFALTDNQKIVTATNASPQTYTVPPNSGAGSVAFPIGTRIDVIQLGDGKVTIAEGSDVIINSYNNFKSIAAKYVGVTLLKIDTDTWVLIGNLIT